jgi:hypothetical protein
MSPSDTRVFFEQEIDDGGGQDIYNDLAPGPFRKVRDGSIASGLRLAFAYFAPVGLIAHLVSPVEQASCCPNSYLPGRRRKCRLESGDVFNARNIWRRLESSV